MKLKKGKFTKGKLASLFGFKSQEESIASEGSSAPNGLMGIELAEERESVESDYSLRQPAAVRVDQEIDLIENNKISKKERFGSEKDDILESEGLTLLNAPERGAPGLGVVDSIDNQIEVDIHEAGMEYDDHLVVDFTKEQLAQCEKKLAEFMRLCAGAYGALLSTVDGHELVYLFERDLPAHKIATMNSSLLALGETIAREALQRLCQFVILENSDGRVVSLRVSNILMLTCIASEETNLGMLLRLSRNTASSLTQIMHTEDILDRVLRDRLNSKRI
ncbi:MAG: hypothetical protein IPK63_14395 [Candidatus Competibacteraceae bacterium]|nr:hypothetical protein [Candidatus Competibacteraceae bacterium]